MMKKFLFLCGALWLSPALFAQYSISGKITDEHGQALIGASVKADGTLRNTTSDREGTYLLRNLTPGNYTLEISFVGYKKETRNVTISDAALTENFTLVYSATQFDEIALQATRISENTGIAVTNVSKKDIDKNNLGVDLPYLLDQTPSVVVSSDAGTGIGYTGIRIRGSDATRINVTVNGIPINDAESQGMFWVNMPDFASSTDNIQVQRGVGSSTHGSGAFGGSINLQTNTVHEKAYGEFSNAFGSFNTRKHTFKAGTGLINNRFTFDARLSALSSDGYIERAASELKSFYTSSAYIGKNNSVRLNIFSGKEHTYQAWGGVPPDSMQTNRRYNPYTYDNETDNYTQTHYQLFYNQQLSRYWMANVALHYTRGLGYYEQYKEDRDFEEYGLTPLVIGSDTVSSTDLIQRRWLDNHFYGGVYSLRYERSGLEAILGGGWHVYEGAHFGEIIWARYASDSDIRKRYYDNDARKSDFNVYGKVNYRFNTRFSAFADLQLRTVAYDFLGFNQYLENVQQQARFTFFNPKAGLSYDWNNTHRVYASFAVGNKEPNRDDFTESSPTTRPTHETLYDTEAGYVYTGNRVVASVNAYYMDYHNQLVLTGKINDVGAFTRINIKDSYRAGLEMQAQWRITRRIHVAANATLSQNKILNFTEYIDNWDTWGQDSVVYSKTDIAFSPSLIAGVEVGFRLFSRTRELVRGEEKAERAQHLDIAWISKYVGEQYIDNTSSRERMLPAYHVGDVRLTYTLARRPGTELRINLLARNVFNEMYSANAWVYRYISAGTFTRDMGYFPQAGTNFLVGVDFRF